MDKKHSPSGPRPGRTHTSPHHRTILGLTLFGIMLLTACKETAREDWPQLTVLASASLRPVIVSETGEFERTDGTRLNIEYLDNDRLEKALREGQAADVVLLDDWTALAELAKDKIVLDAPWLFQLKREGLVVTAAEGNAIQVDTPEDLLNSSLGRIGMVENGQGYSGRLTREALHACGVLKPVESRLWQAHSRGRLARAIRDGEVQVGVVSEKDYDENKGQWREGLKALQRIQFVHELPGEYAGGIVSTSEDIKAARRFWNFIEKAIRVHQAGLRSRTHERM